MKILQAKNLVKNFGQTPALRGATLGVDRGEILAVMLVTHEARIAAYADREIVVRDGTISTLTGVEP
jgi:predicted ABC-type transport system involved in lysophospholipase L1 biosynthesis ATPase subunit